MPYVNVTLEELQRRERVLRHAVRFVMDRSAMGGPNLVYRGDLVPQDGNVIAITGDAGEALAAMFSVYASEMCRAGVNKGGRQVTAAQSAVYLARNECAERGMRINDDPDGIEVKPGFKLAEAYFYRAVAWAEGQSAM